MPVLTSLYLCNSTVYAAVGSPTANGAKITAACQTELPEGCLINGIITNEAELTAALQGFFAANELPVVAEAGSAGESAIQDDESLSQADYVSKSVQTDCLMEVAAGTADAAVLDLTLATAMIGEGTDYANLAIKDELNAEEYGVAFRKGSDVAEAVNAAFDELKADGTMQKLADKYSLTLAE